MPSVVSTTATVAGESVDNIITKKRTLSHLDGAVFKISDAQRLNRFLILGTEGGTYYQKEQDITQENATCALRLISSGHGNEVVDAVVDVSTNGRAPKQNTCLFVLAMCVKLGDEKTKIFAYSALPRIIRIPTHLFSFLDFCEQLNAGGKGWGRAHRRAISKWYTDMDPSRLAMLVTKYAQRGGWTHRDVMRLSHPKTKSDSVQAVFQYIIKGTLPEKVTVNDEALQDKDLSDVVRFLSGVEACKIAQTAEECIGLVKSHGLVREHIPTTMLRELEVWRALLKDMPMTAMIRNLGKMSSLGLLDNGSPEEAYVCSRLGNVELLKKARIHPVGVLIALRTYSRGRGLKGKLTWTVNSQVLSALDAAFYLCFAAVQPTGKRYLHGIDVSGSMDFYSCTGTEVLTARDVACALSMVTARTEPLENNHFLAFCRKATCLDPTMTQGTLDDFISYCKGFDFGGTNCESPILYALEKNIEVDVFVVYTDCETAYAKETPASALKRYRAKMGIPDAKMVVVAATSTGFSIADPDDSGMLDVVGFDPAVPSLISEFVSGKL